MAVINQQAVSLMDWRKRYPGVDAGDIAEMLAQSNEILRDMPFREGNLPTGYRGVVRTGLPKAYWRQLNKGTPATKSNATQVTSDTGILEGISKIDKDLVELQPESGRANFRLSEATAHIESMSQEMASTVFYGDTNTPESFLGFGVRYNTLNADVQTSKNVIDAGGTGSDLTSIWLIGWGDKSMFGIFPRGAQAGLQRDDRGIVDAIDGDGNQFRAYQEYFTWKAGLHVADWRYAVRIANISTSDAVLSNTDLIQHMIRATHRLPSRSGITPAFYMNRTIIEAVDLQSVSKKFDRQVVLTQDQFDGQPVMTVRGIPIRTVDALLNTETQVTDEA